MVIWTKANVQIISDNQEGDGGGEHFLQLSANQISADGMRDSTSTNFKVYTMVKDDFVYTLLECTGGECSGCMLAIRNNELTFVKKRPHSSYHRFSDAEPEVLFKRQMEKVDGIFKLQHANIEHRHFVGFDENGKAITPSQVNPSCPESRFFT